MRDKSPCLAWHFVSRNRRLGYGDGNTVAAGYVYEVEGQIKLCRWGLHASASPLDALRYAMGPIVCRVELSGDIVHGHDKSVATRREVLWMLDATYVLHEFACDVAEKALGAASVTDPRSWAAIKAKRDWLAGDITDLELDAAQGAAWDAAWDTAQVATRAAAQDAAWPATVAAAVAAARVDAQGTAQGTAWDAAQVATRAATQAATQAAAAAAARVDAQVVARVAARVAVRDRHNALLTKMLENAADAEGKQ